MIETRLYQSLDRLEIRDLIENWVLWRDTGSWERLRTLWHDDGRMVTTWCEVDAEEFIDLCKKAWVSGAINANHFLGGTTLEIAGERAIAQTKMMVTQRALLHGVEVDVTSMGRFYDLLERRKQRWAIVLRHPVYERDRVDTVDPSATLALDRTLLSEMPVGYRHLAYLQTHLGLNVNRDLAGRSGPELETLLARGRAWLAGADGRV